MKIVIISDFESAGGAAIATSRLAHGLCQAGQEVIRLVAYPGHAPFPWVTRPSTVRLHRVGQFFRGAANKLTPRFFGKIVDTVFTSMTESKFRQLVKDINPDVINLHNLHGSMLSPHFADTCASIAPTVWTLHDMWSFTGRCAYAMDCSQFITGCDAMCPTPYEYPSLHPSRISPSWKARERIFSAHPDLVAVCPSKWLSEEAQKGLWNRHRVECIPYGLDLDVYQPLDRLLARQALGINPDGPVVLLASQNLNDPRKGGPTLFEAFTLIQSPQLTVLTFGHGRLPSLPNGFNHVSLGYIDHERTRALAYNAADLYAHPALADNLPNVIMESIACGTPVVGFPIGGIPDMVRPNITGWLTPSVSAAALAESLDSAVTCIHNGGTLRQSCRDVACKEYSSTLQAKRYLNLFNDIINR